MTAAHVVSAQVPKREHVLDESDDAVWVDARERWSGRWRGNGPLFIAVADGATESLLGGAWAAMLARTYTAGPSPVGLWETVERAREAWNAPGGRGAASTDPMGAVLPDWLEHAARERGAWSTLLTLCIEGHLASAEAVGDTCLFAVSGGKELPGFPVSTRHEMSSTPPLIAAEPELQPDHPTACWQVSLEPGDELFVVTDALAAWIHGEQEEQRQPLRALRDALGTEADPGAFAAWVGRLRELATLADDDTTAVRILLQ